MTDEKEPGKDEDRNEFEKLDPFPSNPHLISMDRANATMPLSTSNTATLLQAYAARLSSDSDYAR